MKRFSTIALAFVMLFSFAACGSKSEAKELDLAAFTKEVIDTVEYDDDMVALNDQVAADYYNLSFDGLEDWAAYGSGTRATANELMVMKLKDDAAVKKAQEVINSRVDDLTSDYEGYRPDELFRIEDAIVEVQGNYLLFSISPDNDAIVSLFEEALK